MFHCSDGCSRVLGHLITSFFMLAPMFTALDVPPVFTLNLSRTPHQRWDGALKAVLDRHPYEYSFGPVFAHHNASLFGAMSPHQFATIAESVRHHWPETASELAGISSQFAAMGHKEVTFEYLSAWLYFHELAHTDLAAAVNTRECTGVLVQAPDGSVLHAANMDQSPAAARNLTLHVRAIDSDGNLIFEGVDWYTLLSTGTSRALRTGLVSVQENWRTTEPRRVDDVVADIKNGVISQMLVFRRFLTHAHFANLAGTPVSFRDFVENVSATQLAAPFYVIAGGPKRGDGVAIARGLNGVDGIIRLGKDRIDEGKDFFLCQCNTDMWLPDDPTDPRRTAVEGLFHRLGRREGTTQLGLFAIVSAFPVHNPHTAYTALMSAASGEFHAYVREASCPTEPNSGVVKDSRYCTQQASDSPSIGPVSLAV